ncbi:MAG: sigma-54 dependent transcriptional regulator [Bacteroidota bacterium]|nr:sigma-54 dependent transcriptional regulator [Bacteroidota bacterium]
MTAKILVVDDELVICKSCEKIFLRAGHKVKYSTSGKQALALLQSESFDVVFTDLKMLDISGFEVLATIKQWYPETVVIIITGYATIAAAVETMRSGAFDFLPKPFTPAELLAVLNRALEKRKLMQRMIDDTTFSETSGYEGFIGESPKMIEVFNLIRKVAPTDCTVLIIGESGTGKDLTARAIHNCSNRKDKMFFAIDLSTLSSTLLESELFGHMKGSFTGATSDKQGLFEAANNGTIFLDEIGNLSLEVQSRLLRVLQTKEILPVGSTKINNVDVRLIFATNQNLKNLVSEGKFREDLYYRLNVFPIKLPSLRERKDDIPELIKQFLKFSCGKLAKPIPKIGPEAFEVLLNYHWPGNVRELEHTIERLTILVDGDEILPVHISAALFKSETQVSSIIPKGTDELKKLKKQIREASIQEIEKMFVEEALIRNNWNVTKAARDVEMQRSNFQALMRKYGINK